MYKFSLFNLLSVQLSEKGVFLLYTRSELKIINWGTHGSDTFHVDYDEGVTVDYGPSSPILDCGDVGKRVRVIFSVKSYNNAYYGYIKGSNDGENWTTIYTSGNAQNQYGVFYCNKEITLDYRYLKFETSSGVWSSGAMATAYVVD